jgi:hypothetical protein
VILLSPTLFDQLMNGCTGYRAHYAASPNAGERFNRQLVDSVVPTLVAAVHLYQDKVDQRLFKMSLRGPYSKLWFTKDVSDKSVEQELLTLKEVIQFPRWVEHWKSRSEPRKGLLAPLPEAPAVLLNGSFIKENGDCYEQKPERSRELFECGWT